MPTLNEIISSLSDEQITSEAREALMAEVNAQEKKNSQLYSRAKKAEGFEKVNGQWVKKETPKAEKQTGSNEPDYLDKLNKLVLKTEGITNPDAQKFVLDEAKRLNLPVEEILSMEYAKSKVQSIKDQSEAMDGMPKGSGSGSGKNSGDVDYWKDRTEADGTFDTPEDLEMAEKVITARVTKAEQANKFSDTLYNE